MRKLIHLLSVALLAAGSFVVLPTTSHAQDPSIQQRMKERVPAIDELKVNGLVGENNKGFLEARGTVDATAAALIQAENTDRQAAYVAIAGKTGMTPQAVGEGRAAQIAQRSAPGVWLQSPSGSWYKK